MMKINKRELLEKLIQANSWENLSAEEIRLYLFIVICADKVRGTGRLNPEVLEECLGSNFTGDQLEEACHDLENISLFKLEIPSSGSEIKFEFLGKDKPGSKSKEIQEVEGDSQNR